MKTSTALLMSLFLFPVPVFADTALTRTGMHPAFSLLDTKGDPVVGPDSQVSANRTCGTCHDSGFINSHTTHDPGKVQVDCFKCHVPGGLLNLGHQSFGADGRMDVQMVVPGSDVCGRCHGIAKGDEGYLELDDEFLKCRDPGPFASTLHTGEVFSSQLVSESFLNLAGKGARDYPWDVHAARQLDCTDCHFAPNNPDRSAIGRKTGQSHLINDPRSLTISDYLKRPDHRISAVSCTDCHDAKKAHPDLQHRERHLETLACQACHVPELTAPTLRFLDKTVVTSDGGPRMGYRGVEDMETGAANTWFIRGYQPFLLLERQNGRGRFSPYNLVARWEWVSGGDGEVVAPMTLDRAWRRQDGAYHTELIQAFDGNGDGRLGPEELVLDGDRKTTVIERRLADLGIAEPRISARVVAYPVRHSVVDGRRVAADCDSCHGVESRFNREIPLAAIPFPGGVRPEPDEHAASLLGGRRVEVRGGGLLISGGGGLDGFYVPGHSRSPWSDYVGFGAFVLIVIGVTVHAGLRYAGARRRRGEPAGDVTMKRVYMYGAYERVWHWTMAASIIVLLITGFQIHYPLSFSPMEFTTAVFVHNVMALVLMLNAFLSLFYHVSTGEIRQFVPQGGGFVKRVIAQGTYYMKGIFEGAMHPSARTPERKLNPLQQITYVGLLNVLFPLQFSTGLLLWAGGKDPDILSSLGGLSIIGPLHNLGSWLLLTFMVLHVYLTTTGHTPLSNIHSMIDGWEEIESEADETSSNQGALS